MIENRPYFNELEKEVLSLVGIITVVNITGGKEAESIFRKQLLKIANLAVPARKESVEATKNTKIKRLF